MTAVLLDIRPAVSAALAAGSAVVALESTLIAHGLPWPANLETAQAAEQIVRETGATPATIAVLNGRPTVGLSTPEIESLARSREVRKAATRDLGVAVAQRATAATTVSATMRLAHLAGIAVFATGGIGGVHPPHQGSLFDISADLTELGRTPVCVVCAGAKSILDLPATLEVLETNGVVVLGYRTDEFPAFYVPSSGLRVSGRVETPEEASSVLRAHWSMNGAGVVLAQPLPAEVALTSEEFAVALSQAEELSRRERIGGPELTPFLLARLAEITAGKTLQANRSLIVANARLAAEVALSLAGSR